MMYLSTLLVNTGDQNADRPRPGRLWLRNIYHVHQRLSMAFPSRKLKDEDPNFLKPYDPDSFEKRNFLFRIDRGVRGDQTRTVILVQSELEPDWEYAFQNAPLLCCHQKRPYEQSFAVGESYRYRILINLTTKDKTAIIPDKRGRTDRLDRPKTQSKRTGLRWDEKQNPTEVIVPWFQAKAAHNGFEAHHCEVSRIGWIAGQKPKIESDKDKERPKWHEIRQKVALIEGCLSITDADKFRAAIQNGIGSGKAFGCGLLSVMPLG